MSCFLPIGSNFRIIEADKKGDNDFNANVFSNGNVQVNFDQNGENVDGVVTASFSPVLIGEVRIEIDVDPDKDLKIKKFLDRDPCVGDEVIDVDGIEGTCNGGNEIKFDKRDNGFSFDFIKFAEISFNCDPVTLAPTPNPTLTEETLGPTESPVKSPTTSPSQSPVKGIEPLPPTVEAKDLENQNEIGGMMLAMGVVGGFATVLLLCAAFVVVKNRKKEKVRNRDIMEVESPYAKKNETLVQVVTSNRAQGIQVDSHQWRESINQFDTRDLTRLSGLSMLTTNTAQTTKTDITQKDFDNYHRVRSVVSDDKRKFAALSQMVANQVNRLSMNTLELRNKDEDINERVLNKVVPFVKALLKPHQTKKTDMMKFNLKSAPRVSLKFYMSRLIMGLNQWFYEDEVSNEIGLRCLFLTLIYLDKLPQKVKGFQVTNLNVYKLLAVFMLIAAKFTEDDIITNTYWADVCGYGAKEVNDLEALLCFKFGFSFDVDPDHLSNLFQLFNEKQITPGMKSNGGPPPYMNPL